MNEGNLVFDYQNFYNNLNIFKLLSKLPIEDFTDIIEKCMNNKIDGDLKLRKEGYMKMIQKVSEEQISISDKEKWVDYRIEMPSIVFLSALYAEKTHI
ncbi:hypothetical protein ACVRYP_09750 [Streptococcus rifensis]